MKTCSIFGCVRPHQAHGWCDIHYQRWRRHGNPLGGGPACHPNGTLGKWIIRHVHHASDECLIWPFEGSRGKNGYGQLRYKGRRWQAHRFMCALAHGEPPTPKHEAAHSCGKGHEGCVNPRHLRWATSAENHMDRIAHGNSNRGERHGNAKLTEADVRKIRTLKGTMLQREIAEAFGVSRRAVSLIQNRERWSWVQDVPRVELSRFEREASEADRLRDERMEAW